jgi:hypothetical protein
MNFSQSLVGVSQAVISFLMVHCGPAKPELIMARRGGGVKAERKSVEA